MTLKEYREEISKPLSEEQIEIRRRIDKAVFNALYFHVPYPDDLPSPFETWNAHDYYEI